MRVAVIEVGSRSTRLLIAELANGTLATMASGVIDLDLMRAVNSGDHSIVARLREGIDQFERKARAAGAVRTAVFGTEAARKLRDAVGAAGFEGIEVIGQKEEAHCSLIAAARSMAQVGAGTSICVIDHGNGSLELASGLAGVSIDMRDFLSVTLGSERLLRELAISRSNLDEFTAWAHGQVDGLDLPKSHSDILVIQGSVPTKCAWIAARNDLNESYDAKRVHGRSMQAHNLRQFIATVRSKPQSEWAALSRFVNPKDKPTDQIQRLVTGCIVLERLLKRMNHTEFLVGAYGTRFGFAWKLLDLDTAIPASIPV